jgi:cysteine desulfurase
MTGTSPDRGGRRVYLDWNASAPLRPEARAAMRDAMDGVGNPSSVHAEGRAAKAILSRAREQVATLAGCDAAEVVFTSGATEAAAVLGRLPPEVEVLVDPVAHDCLWCWARSAAGGARPDAALALGTASGETGIAGPRPVRDAAGWVWSGRRARWLLLDAVQSAGRTGFDFAASGADLALLSGHKLGGPKGTGALIVRAGLDLPPVLRGGGQERGRRAGTENVIGIAGFGAAAAAARRDLQSGVWERVGALRDRLEDRLAETAPEIIIFGRGAARLPNTSCFAVPGWRGEIQVMQMDLAGFAVSAGSACSSGRVGPSRVLKAMGHDDVTAASAIRVSMGPATTEAEVTAFADAWLEHYRRFARKAA